MAQRSGETWFQFRDKDNKYFQIVVTIGRIRNKHGR